MSQYTAQILWQRQNGQDSPGYRYSTRHHQALEECFTAKSVTTDVRCEPVCRDA